MISIALERLVLVGLFCEARKNFKIERGNEHTLLHFGVTPDPQHKQPETILVPEPHFLHPEPRINLAAQDKILIRPNALELRVDTAHGT